MCRTAVRLKVPCEIFSCEGWNMADIDQCIAPIVEALNTASIYTMSSCCGHNKELGYIWLKDGRVLVITPSDSTKEQIDKLIHSVLEEVK